MTSSEVVCFDVQFSYFQHVFTNHHKHPTEDLHCIIVFLESFTTIQYVIQIFYWKIGRIWSSLDSNARNIGLKF